MLGHLLFAQVPAVFSGETGIPDHLKDMVDRVNVLPGIKSSFSSIMGQSIIGVVEQQSDLVEAYLVMEECQLAQGRLLGLKYAFCFGELDGSPRSGDEVYGQALTTAHRLIEKMKKAQFFAIQLKNEAQDKHLYGLMQLTRRIMSDWPKRNYELIAAYLHQPNYQYLVDQGHYSAVSGAWKIVHSLRLKEYLVLRQLMRQTMEWEFATDES